jgi:hypothetical protein
LATRQVGVMEGWGKTALEGFGVPGGCGVIMVPGVVVGGRGRCWLAGDVEVFDRRHVDAHSGGPLLYLWADVGEECVGGPSPQYHDFLD